MKYLTPRAASKKQRLTEQTTLQSYVKDIYGEKKQNGPMDQSSDMYKKRTSQVNEQKQGKGSYQLCHIYNRLFAVATSSGKLKSTPSF